MPSFLRGPSALCSEDVICARDKYPLLAALRERRGVVRAQVVPWRDGRAVLAAVREFVASLQHEAASGGSAVGSSVAALRADAAAVAKGLACLSASN